MKIHNRKSPTIADFCLGDVIRVRDFNGIVVDTVTIGRNFTAITLAWRDEDGKVHERRFSEHILLSVVNGYR